MTPPLDLTALARLKQAAEAATPGPWFRTPPPTPAGDTFASGVLIAATAASKGNRVYADPPGGSYPSRDADLIALCDPPTILALVAQVEEQAAKLTQSRTAGRAEGLDLGLKNAAWRIEKMRDAFMHENFSYDPSTGAWEGTTAQEEYVETLDSAIDAVRGPDGLASDPAPGEIPKVTPRRSWAEDVKDEGYLESDDDFISNNHDACIWFLEHRDTLAAQRQRAIETAAREMLRHDGVGPEGYHAGKLFDARAALDAALSTPSPEAAQEIERLREALDKLLERYIGASEALGWSAAGIEHEDVVIGARAALASTPPGAERGEWKLVPVEPTREMWAAAGDAVVNLVARNILHHDKLSDAVWKAMLAAAPPSSRETEGHG